MSGNAGPILVVGANGRSGGLAARALSERGMTVRALLRSDGEAATARANGATEIAIGDLRDNASLDAALRGASGVYHVGPPFVADEAELGIAMVEAAARANVRKLVFSAVIHTANGLANHASKLPVERAILRSNLDYTIVYPATLFQNFDASWARIAATGIYAEPIAGAIPLARVDYRDVAEVVAQAFTGERLTYGSFELASDAAHDRAEVARLMETALGRPVSVATPPFDEWIAATKPPLDARQREQLGQVYESYDAFGSPGNSLALRTILGRAPRTLASYFDMLVSRTA